MLAFVLFGLMACAYAAPRNYHFHPPPPFPHDDHFPSRPYFGESMFDVGRFWAEMSRDLAMIDQMMNEFTKHFPNSVSDEETNPETNEYKITIPLNGFDEKDISVKAREGVLMVQAIKKQEDNVVNSYLNARTLPPFVNVTGSWTYNRGLLKIVFPLLPRGEGGIATEDTSTTLPEELRPESTEDVNNHNTDGDADVGVSRGNSVKDILTNEIPNRETIEATTYAVDLKNEVEFVPVNY